jgi:tetratricopeptide (TPR) repeat protein
MGLVHWRQASNAIFRSTEDSIKISDDAFQEAKQALQKALDLDPDLAVARSRMAGIQWQHDWDFSGAERSTARALAADPTNPSVMANSAAFYDVLGRSDEAIELLNRIIERDPINVTTYQNLCATYSNAGRFEEAAAAARRGLVLDPDHPDLLYNLIFPLTRLGRIDEAKETKDRLMGLIGEDRELDTYFGELFAYYDGERNRADELMADYEKEFCGLTPSTCAGLYARRGNSDAAFQWLEKAYALREPGLPFSKVDPDLRLLRNDPRWNPFWQKVGIPPNS